MARHGRRRRTGPGGPALLACLALACLALASLALATPAAAQTCGWMPKPIAEKAIPYLAEGTVVQGWCAPCRDRRAVAATVAETAIRPIDTYNHQVLINGQPNDLAYLYVFDARRKRWTNLGLLIGCHEEDDVPPTLPADKVAR